MKSKIIITIIALLIFGESQLLYCTENTPEILISEYMEYILLLENEVDLNRDAVTKSSVEKGTRAAIQLISGREGNINREDYSPKKRVNELWSDLWVPQYAHGNDGIVFAVQAVHKKYDAQVISWILDNYKSYSPFILMEASRRLVDKDINQAVYWYLVGLWKIRDEVKKCNKFTASDVPTYWRDYGLKYLLPEIQKHYPGNHYKVFHQNLKRVLDDWDELIPPGNQSWLRCKTDSPDIKRFEVNNRRINRLAQKQYDDFLKQK